MADASVDVSTRRKQRGSYRQPYGPVPEGSTGLASFSEPFDPSNADTTAGFRYSYDFDNDGSFEVVDSVSTNATVPASLLDDGPGAREVRARIKVKDDGYTDYTTTMTIINVAPLLSADSATLMVAEGQTATNTGTWSDPGVDDVTLSASVGSITKNANGTWSWSFDTTDGPDQSQTVTITATDSDSAVTTTTFALVVNNVAPMLSVDNASVTVSEGQTPTNTGPQRRDHRSSRRPTMSSSEKYDPRTLRV
jgi:hypothetical protein